jgi:cell division inhibitor SepF
MAGFFKKALDYLGLDDDEYQDYDPYEDQQPATRRAVSASQPVEPEPVSALTYPRGSNASGPVGIGGITAVNQPASDSGVSGVVTQGRASSPAVRTITATKSVKVHVTVPTEFSEVQDIGERYRTGQPVIIDLRETDREAAKRLIDFSSGLAFALNGDIKKVHDRVFLLRPNGVDLPADEQRRLRDAGLMR